MLRYSSTTTPPVRPKRLRFGLLSAKDIRGMSVCHVTETTLYYRGLPASGGLLDPLMGTVDRRHLCASCMNDPRTCEGHAGHIELSFPVYHIGFVDMVLKTLRTVCFACCAVSLTEDERDIALEYDAKARLTFLHNHLRNRKKCPHCEMTRPTITRAALGLKVEWPADMTWESQEEEEFCRKTFTARDALSILRNISERDLTILGFDPVASHPMDMIMQCLVVPPPCTRPAIYSSEGSRSRGQNDLTVRLLEILKRSHEVATGLGDYTWETLPDVSTDILERLARLQYEVYMMVNNSARIPKPAGMGRNSSNAAGKSLQERLKGKEGRVRGNLMGKRVDFSARCVITPDAYFECDRVGVPYRIAKTLTIPERVNATNIRQLTRRVQIGAKSVHGAQAVIHANGHVTDLERCTKRDEIVLRQTDIVERYLADDDTVVFNRQPSLHMHSMQAHRVRLMPGHTFRLSLPVATPYNADFDGDEMNLHVPQSLAASTECSMLMGVSQNCIGAQGNRPVMGIVQDSLLGLYLLSQKDVLLDHPHMCRLIGRIRHVPDIHIPPPTVTIVVNGKIHTRLWSGKRMFSILLPTSMYIEGDRWGDDVVGDSDPTLWRDSELPVVVYEGQLLTGVLRKPHVGTGAGGIVDTLCREHGGVASMRFMGDAQRVTHEFLLQRGHHVGIDDVMLSRDGHERVTERLDKATKLCEEIQREMVDAPQDMMRTGERAILRLLSKTLLQTGGIVNEHMNERNAIRRMVTAGSKGSFINLSQICAALGQQSLEGSRIVADKGNRTLPCFAHNDLSLASRGMVHNSFALGLSPSELFFHAIGGREGLVDTAVKTSQTGYLQRRMNKSMEDNAVRFDGTIRNSVDEVVSFLWGSDGMHPTRIERLKLALLTEDVEHIRKRMTPAEATMALEARTQIRHVKTHILAAEFDNRVLVPFNMKRLIRRIARERDGAKTPVDPKRAEARVLELATPACRVVQAALLDVLCTSRVAGMEADKYEAMMDEVEMRITHARSTAAESAGCIAAQSVGEPATQLSVAYDTKVMVSVDGQSQSVPIGPLIDSYLPPVNAPDQHDVMPVDKLRCVGVSPIGTVAWGNVTHVSRHPANGTILTVTTSKGREVAATAAHSFLVRKDNRIVAVPGSSLVVGDALPIVKDLHSDEDAGADLPSAPFPLNRATGRWIGAVVSEGVCNQNTIQFHTPDRIWMDDIMDAFEETTEFRGKRSRYTTPDSMTMYRAAIHSHTLATWMVENFGRISHDMTHTLPAWILTAPSDFVSGLFQTLYDGNGCITNADGHDFIRYVSVSRDLVTMMTLGLARFGIPSFLNTQQYHTPAGAKGAMQVLCIPCSFAAVFQTHIGFSCGRKAERLVHEVAVHGDGTRNGWQSRVPGCNSILEELRSHVPCGGNKNSYETLLRKELRRIQRKPGITPQMLLRCRQHAVEFNAPDHLLAEFDYAIHADVWWDPITSITSRDGGTEMVYDFTVEQELQSFMLTNGLFVHNTLNSFHTAGCASKNVTLGIPRLKELLDASKTAKTPCTTLRFHPPYSTSVAFAEYMSCTLPLTRLGDIVSKCDVLKDPDGTAVPEDAWMIACEEMLDVTPSEDASAYVVRLELQQDTMRARHLTPPMVRRILNERLEGRATVMASEVNSVEWVIRMRYNHVRRMITTGGLMLDDEAIICHRSVNVLLDTVVVSGHPCVSSANSAETVMEDNREQVVHAYGTFLMDCAASQCIDWARCTSNDVWEVYHALGVEACAHVLFEQLKVVVSFDGTYVDDRHLLLIVDTMCRNGTLMPLNRHGINRTDTSPLMRCSFEETTDVLCEAAIFAQQENARGVSSSIMSGQLASIGTGTVRMHVRDQETNRIEEQLHPRGRVLRSTCRSFARRMDDETLEYVMDDVRPVTTRALSPPTIESSATRKRARFRPVSPSRS